MSCFLYFLHIPCAVKTALWSETTEVKKDVPVGKVKGWRCNHCGIESWIEILLVFSFIYQETLNSEKGFCGIEVCKKVPDAVSQIAEAEMLEKSSEKDSSTKRSASAAGAHSGSGTTQTRRAGFLFVN